MGKKITRQEKKSIERLFKSFLPVGEETIPWDIFCETFLKLGLSIETDSRLKPILKVWQDLARPQTLSLSMFSKISHPALPLIDKAAQNQLVLPEFESFSDDLYTIYFNTKENTEGKIADYIPQLSRVPADKYGVAICSIDGQRQSLGDASEYFCVQSTCKPISYCLALEEQGEQIVHQHVGREPSGHTFNELSLNRLGLPHNPMINAGAIMTSAMIKPTLSRGDRFDYVIENWARLMGGQRPNFSNPVYLSERETADRNFALGYFMREHNAFPKGTDLIDTLEFYFQCCALEVTAEMMSVLAATLANGGVCPLTGESVFQPDTVQRCLSLMYSCGMYDFSGEWAFSVGLPAKSGISGAIMVVIPGVMGVCTWSPLLDSNCNSIRGIHFYKALLKKYNFHNFDILLENSLYKQTDPRYISLEVKSQQNAHLLWACSTNDIREIKSLIAKGVDLTESDYDNRTALHLAASEGHLDVVKLLVHLGVPIQTKDRWGHMPIDDAKRSNHQDVINWLSKHIATQHKKQKVIS